MFLDRFSHLIIRGTFIASWGVYYQLLKSNYLVDFKCRRSSMFLHSKKEYILPTWELSHIFNDVCNQTNLPASLLRNVGVTASARYSPSVSGTLSEDCRSFVHVPFTYHCKYVTATPPLFSLNVAVNLPVEWMSEKGQYLCNRLQVNEKEVKFVLARQLYELSSKKSYVQFASFSITTYLCYELGLYGLKALPGYQALLRQGKRSKVLLLGYLILAMYTMVPAYCLHRFWMRFYERSVDYWADAQVVALGPQWLDAGIAYYNSLLEKNLVLLEYWPRECKRYIKANGDNRNKVIKAPCTSIERRLARLEKLKLQADEAAESQIGAIEFEADS